MTTGHDEAATRRGGGFRRFLVYLALLPVLIAAGIGAYFAVRIALSPPKPAVAATGQMASTEEELATVGVVVERTRNHLMEDRFGRAEALLLGGLEKFPREQELWLLYAEVLMQGGDFEKALAAFETAIEIGPDHPEYRNAAGTLASQVGDKMTAEYHWTAGQNMDPADPRFPFYLAQIQRAEGRVDEARKNLVLATHLNPDLAEAWGTLASIAMDEGNLSPALQHIERAKVLEPERGLWRLIEARVLRRQGDPRRAAAVLSAIPERQRFTDPNILRELGLCFGLMREPMEAAETYLEAIAYIAILNDETHMVHDEHGEVIEDRRIPASVRAELHYEAALWLERGEDLSRAATQANLASRLGHAEAAAMLERLEAKGVEPTALPPLPAG